MNRRRMLTLTTVLISLSGFALGFLPGNAPAQQVADIEGIKAASKTFYVTLSVLDDGTAMEKVWARTPYVTYVGPRSKSVVVGWDAQKKYWEDFNKAFAKRSVSIADQRVHANGNLGWEIGVEVGEALMKDGSTRKIDWIVTNVYEKIDGRWLMVSHHVQPRPQ